MNQKSSAAEQSSTQQIEVRRLRFGLSYELPKYWNNGDDVKTYIFNAIALLAPAFERLAITSVLPYRENIQDPVLKQQVQGFIGQESAHGSEFIRMQCLLKNQGYNPKQIEKLNIDRFKALAQKFSPEMHLSFTLAAEHVTAVISDLLLTEKTWLSGAPKEMAALWRWHAIEEIDHKAVVFDLYKAVGGSYWVRVKGMLLMTFVLWMYLTRNYAHLAKTDKKLLSPKFWFKTVWILWGRPGFMRKQLKSYFGYFMPNFHPWRKNNYHLIKRFKEVYAELPKLKIVDFLSDY
ncbi:MAG: metal-dependent hydrolase [Candidatus Berkiella sp.]